MYIRPLMDKKLLVVLACALLGLLLPAFAFGQAPNKNVLVFYSDGINGPAAAIVNHAIRSTLKDSSTSPTQIYDESTDSFRIPTEKYEAEMVKLLQQKYQGARFDLIFAISTPALKFLLQHRSELFANVPIVFLVNDESRVADLDLQSNITGVWGKAELSPTLDMALAAQPETRNVVVTSGNATLDKGLLALAQKEFRAYEGRMSFTYLTDLTPEEVRQRLAALPDKTVVIFLSFNVDRAGKKYTSPEVVSLLSPTSHAPIYASSELYLGDGIVGGRLLSWEGLGLAAGQMGLRILAGESAQSIPRQTVPSVTMFDWRQLRRWNIDENKLPAGSVIRFREFSFWELYKWRIIGAFSIIGLQALGIVWLLFIQAKRRQAEKKSARFAMLAESERQHLDEIVANVPGIVWEATLEAGDPVPKTTFISPYVEKMLGYSVEEWLSTPGFVESVILEDDREKANREIATILANGNEGVLRSRWVAKDRRVLWVETHLAATPHVTGKTVGLLGVTLDISDPKRHEAALQRLTGRLLMLQEEERRRVAGELHDGLGQNLAIIKNRAMIGLREQRDHDRVKEQLEEIASTATASILEVREIAHNLRPYELDRLGLVSAIESMIERVSDTTSINLSSALEPIDGLLSSEAETSAYRIVQEGLNNVVKHSHATAARIEIMRSGKQLFISVQDNGKGIPKAVPAYNGQKAGGFGLTGIAERVRVLGGTFIIDSEPPNGTTLTVRLELRNGSEK